MLDYLRLLWAAALRRPIMYRMRASEDGIEPLGLGALVMNSEFDGVRVTQPQ